MALALQHDDTFKEFKEEKGRFKDFEYYELLDLGLNAVFYLKYPTRNANNTTVMKLLPEKKHDLYKVLWLLVDIFYTIETSHMNIQLNGMLLHLRSGEELVF